MKRRLLKLPNLPSPSRLDSFVGHLGCADLYLGFRGARVGEWGEFR